jgi:hypothetical protein
MFWIVLQPLGGELRILYLVPAVCWSTTVLARFGHLKLLCCSVVAVVTAHVCIVVPVCSLMA